MIAPVVVDTNVILDLATDDPDWADWSARMLREHGETARLVVNPVIYAEVSVGFEKIEDVELRLPVRFFDREDIPYEAAFLAGKCFAAYRRRGGTRTSTLPDFFIGAHAAVRGYRLLTRDAARYRTYFPGVALICPDG